MGIFFGLFQKDDIAELKKDREYLIEKKVKIEAEIEAIDEKIASLESEA